VKSLLQNIKPSVNQEMSSDEEHLKELDGSRAFSEEQKCMKNGV